MIYKKVGPKWTLTNDSDTVEVSSDQVIAAYVTQIDRLFTSFRAKAGAFLVSYIKRGVVFGPRNAVPSDVQRTRATWDAQRLALLAIIQVIYTNFSTNCDLGYKYLCLYGRSST